MGADVLNNLDLLIRVRRLLLALVISVCAIPSLAAETLGVRYLNSPRSMKTFSYVTTQCAAHYLANATKVTDQLASKSGSTKDEAIALYMKAAKFHMEITALTEGMIHSKDNPPVNIAKLTEQLMVSIITLAAEYAPSPAEYQSASDLCQAIHNNPKQYTSKVDQP